MKNKKSTIRIGMFVFTSLAILVLLLMAIGGTSLFSSNPKYTLYFDTSVKGLALGAPVMFRGVRIGQVTSIQLSAPKANRRSRATWPIEVTIEIMPSALDVGKSSTYDNGSFYSRTKRVSFLLLKGDDLVDDWLFTMVNEHHMCAQLQQLSILTGQMYIQLNFFQDYTASKQDLLDLTRNIIPTRISPFTRILETLQKKEQSQALSIALATLSEFVTSGKCSNMLNNMSNAMENISQISTDAREVVSTFRKDTKSSRLNIFMLVTKAFEVLENANTTLKTINGKLPGMLVTTNDAISDLKARMESISAKADKVMTNLEQTSTNLNNAIDLKNGPMAQIITEANDVMSDLKATLAHAQGLLQSAESCLAEDSPERQSIQHSLEQVNNAANSIRSLADTIQHNPEVLIRGK